MLPAIDAAVKSHDAARTTHLLAATSRRAHVTSHFIFPRQVTRRLNGSLFLKLPPAPNTKTSANGRTPSK